MEPDRFARLRDIVLALLDVPESGRAARLDALCAGDADLRSEAEDLLGATRDHPLPDFARTGGSVPFVEALSPPAEPRPANDQVPERIGRYRILGIAGEGGMGTVYRAEQTHPFHREVAVKLLHRGQTGGSVLARFAIEQQILALLDHPHIARVYDAGEDEEQRPYFVMELVDGSPITDYCDRVGLSLRGRVQLFRDVCHAVQHAHQKGIIHRDLKPSNILVTETAGKATPKVIDFGIAKALEGSPSDLTAAGFVIGTLDYMSPEQVTGRTAAVDTRSDVYSLGVVLHLLVSGSLPYDIGGRPLLEAVRIIAGEGSSSTIRTSLRDRAVDGDIATIVAKALEKNPEERYASASALAEDLDRYLEHQPIMARPHSTMYQVRMLIARNRIPSILVGSILFLVIVFGITMSVLFGMQRHERARAEAEGRKASRINRFLNDMLSSVDPRRGSKDVTVREVLDRAAAGMDSGLASEPEIAAAVHKTIGETYFGLALYQPSIKHLRMAMDSWSRLPGDHREEMLASMQQCSGAMMRLSMSAEAETMLDRAATEYGGFLGEKPDLAAELAYMQAMAQMNQLKLDEAEQTCRRAIDLWRSIPAGGDSTQLAGYLGGLSVIMERQGRYPDAESAVREVLALRRRILRPDHPSLASSLNDLGLILRRQNNLAGADSFYQEALSIRKRVLDENDDMLAVSYGNLGFLRREQGRLAEAESLVRIAYNIESRARGPTDASAIKSLLIIAEIRIRRGDGPTAERYCREAIVALGEGGTPMPRPLVEAWWKLGKSLRLQGRGREAEAAFREGLSVARGLEGPARSPVAADLFEDLVALLREGGRTAEAKSMLEQKRTMLGVASP